MVPRGKKHLTFPRNETIRHTLPQRNLRREQRRATMRRSATIVVVLCALIGVGGIGYTWYAGKQKPVAVEQPNAAPDARRNIIKPPKIASDAAIGSSVQSVTGEVKRGENASVTVRTNPEANCAITVSYNKVPAVDSGLAPKPADEFGIVSWAWTVKSDAAVGLWPAEVTCSNKKNSSFVKAEFKVTP